MGKSVYENFRGVLRKAISGRKQAVFAKEAGISPEHLNRMLNANEINRPSKQTLIKIASNAYNGVTYDDLERALNKEDPDYHEETYADLKLAEARNDFKRSFDERASHCLDIINNCVESIISSKGPYVTSDLNDVMELVFEQYKVEKQQFYDLEDMIFSYDIGPEREYHGHIYDDVTHWTSVILTIADNLSVVESAIIMYFSHLPKANVVVLQHMTMSMENVVELYGYPASSIRYWKSKGLPDEDCLDATSREVYMFNVVSAVGTKTLDRMFSMIMRPQEECFLDTVYGFGFNISKVPDKYANFITLHKDSVLDAYKKNMNEYVEMKESLEELIAKNASNEEFVALMEAHPVNAEEYCWQSTISRVMRLETGFPFHAYMHETPPEGFSDVSTEDFILISEEGVSKVGIHERTLIHVTEKYARQLGVDSFGDEEFTFVDMRFAPKRKRHFKIDPDSDTTVTGDTMKWVSIEEEKPDETGMYWVELKDGREYQMLYSATNDHWIANHKEWSDMIALWDKKLAITNIDEESSKEYVKEADEIWNSDIE